MSTARPALAASHRTITGKAVVRLRREGRLPAVVYGHGVESRPITIDAHEFELLRRRVGPNALIDLSVDGKKPTRVLIHGVGVNPVSRRPLHVDLFEVRMTEELTVDVPVVLVGESEAVTRQGGTLSHETDRVKVKALPDHLPQRFELSIESLVDFETRLHVSDLAIPEGVTLLTSPDEVLAHVLAPRVEEAAVPEAAAAAEGAAAEGAGGAAAGAAPAEGGAEESSAEG